jgi:sigma-B regulation protein RsbU (phosphoserine phosphatase)
MLLTRSQLRTHPLAYAALSALFILSVSVFVRGISDSSDLIRHSSVYARPPFDLGDGNWGAVNLQPEAEEQGIKFGDAVLAVNGHPVDGFYVYYGELRRARAGEPLQVRVQSPGPGNLPVRDLSIALRPYRNVSETPVSLTDYVQFTLGSLLQPAICLALGFWVAVVRVDDRSAWFLLSLMLSFASIVGFGGTGYPTLFGRDAPLQAVFAAFQTFFSSLTSPALMLFGIGFPERLPLDRRFPWLKWIIAGYLIIVAALAATGVGLWVDHVALARQVSGRPLALLTGVQGDFGGAVSFLALLVCVLSLGWKAITAQTRDARRRLTLLFAGAAPGAVALLIFLVAGRLEYRLPSWTILPLGTTMLVFPLTMAYVIVVHRAMDVGVVVRQGLQYVLATRGVRLLQIAIGVAIITTAAMMSANTSVLSRVMLMSIGFGLLAVLQAFAGRLRRWIDRQFFREAYESDAILSDLAMRVRTMIETGPLLETVATRIADSLHVSRIAILLENGGAFRPAYALGYSGAPQAEIAADGTIASRLRKQQPAVVRFDDRTSWVQLADQDERDALAELQSDLLLPLSFNEKLLGIMSLGPKQSEEPFSPTDIRLLDSVAAQTGLALENGRLTAAVKAEATARAKQMRDIEIARDVQQRLFPQDYPPMPGLDYAGACRAALGVGGDYYDFIQLAGTRLGIAIGDVSGKGVPASLLMATLRAYLRGAQTIHHQADLTVVMANLNRLVYDSSDANRYATFFYGEFDSASRVLNYVNGGHNPPMLFRRSDGARSVVRLETGGPVIGLMEDCAYNQACVTIEPGDVLVAFTDGISEAMNPADEEWGDDRLIDAVRSNLAATARDLIVHIVRAADTFVAGAPQHDDMTAIVVRVG